MFFIRSACVGGLASVRSRDGIPLSARPLAGSDAKIPTVSKCGLCGLPGVCVCVLRICSEQVSRSVGFRIFPVCRYRVSVCLVGDGCECLD